MEIKRGKQAKARRTLLYGTPGIGKSTIAAKWPEALFIDCEDGLADIDCAKIGPCEELRHAWEPLMKLVTDSEGFQTVIVDTIDWLEQLVAASVCAKNGWKQLSDGEYGKGVEALDLKFREYLHACGQCIKAGINIVFVAHAAIVKHTPPGQESYDKWEPKCNKRLTATLIEWCDEVFFADYKVFTTQADEGFGQKRNIAANTAERVIYTNDRPFARAKNRLNLQEELSFEEFEQVVISKQMAAEPQLQKKAS